MNLLFALLFSFFASATETKKVLVAPPALPESEFVASLSQNDQLQRVSEALIVEYLRSPVRPEIFEMMDLCLKQKDCRSLTKNFELLREKTLITPTERDLLLELWQKSGKKIDCYWNESKACAYQKIHPEKLGLDPRQNYILLVDGQIFRNDQEIRVLPNRKYHWRILTDRFQPKEAWATADELHHQITLKNPYVTGGCLSSSVVEGVPADLRSRMVVAFDRSCVRGLDEVPRSAAQMPESTWMQRNRGWLVPTLILVGGSAYLLKDHDIEFQNSFR